MEQKWICPNCGAEMAVRPKFCEYCDTETTEDKPPELGLMDQAGNHMMGGRFREAGAILHIALEQEPENSDLWILLLLCKLEKTDIDDLAQADRLLSGYEEFGKALEFAKDHQEEVYRRLEAKNRQFLLEKKKRLEQEIGTLKKRTDERKWKLGAMEPLQDPPGWKKGLWLVEKVFVIISVAFLAIGVIADISMLVVEIPFVVWLVFIFKREKKRTQAEVEFPGLQRLQQEELKQMVEKFRYYKAWLAESGLAKEEK